MPVPLPSTDNEPYLDDRPMDGACLRITIDRGPAQNGKQASSPFFISKREVREGRKVLEATSPQKKKPRPMKHGQS